MRSDRRPGESTAWTSSSQRNTSAIGTCSAAKPAKVWFDIVTKNVNSTTMPAAVTTKRNRNGRWLRVA